MKMETCECNPHRHIHTHTHAHSRLSLLWTPNPQIFVYFSFSWIRLSVLLFRLGEINLQGEKNSSEIFRELPPCTEPWAEELQWPFNNSYSCSSVCHLFSFLLLDQRYLSPADHSWLHYPAPAAVCSCCFFWPHIKAPLLQPDCAEWHKSTNMKVLFFWE